MANTYSQMTVHCVFAVKHRENLLRKPWRYDLFRYISGILDNMDCMPFAVNGWIDHVHVLFALPVTKNVADVMEIVKTNSSKWINEQKFVFGKFQWQLGYGAFSLSKSHRDRAIKYLMNQENHHGKMSFKEEYEMFLNLYEIAWDERYVFEYYDDLFEG